MSNHDEDPLVKQVVRALDDDIHLLNDNVCAHLQRSRVLAVKHAAKKQHFYHRLTSPIWGMATAIVMLIGVLGLWPQSEKSILERNFPRAVELSQLDNAEFDLLTAADDFEFYQTLEFIEWLEYEHDAG